MIREFAPDAIHIATEGTLGLSRARDLPQIRHPVHHLVPHALSRICACALSASSPEARVYRFLRWFHGPATAMMVATPSLQARTREPRLQQCAHLVARRRCRAVPPDCRRDAFPFRGPILLYVGRVAVEKNIEAFLALDLPGTKVIVGDGPARAIAGAANIPTRNSSARRSGDDLVRAYAASDVFVFPSRTDTFGLVMLEALACGTPVAAYPVQGPLDVVGDARVAALDDDLARCLPRGANARPRRLPGLRADPLLDDPAPGNSSPIWRSNRRWRGERNPPFDWASDLL